MKLYDSGWVRVNKSPEFLDIAELIHRRRRQILVHSILYYKLDANLIPDHTFDEWAAELAYLQKAHPRISLSVNYHYDAFSDFTGETGAFLPLRDIPANYIAKRLLRMSHGE